MKEKIKDEFVKKHFLFLIFLIFFLVQALLLSFVISNHQIIFLAKPQEKGIKYSFDIKFLPPTPAASAKNNSNKGNRGNGGYSNGEEIDLRENRPVSVPSKSVKGKVYYYQCSDVLRNTRMPGLDCTYCQKGCGPTTVAMIISTYVTKFSPVDVGEFYKKHGFYLGCDGTILRDAKRTLERFGFKTSEVIFSNPEGYPKKAVVDDMKAYIDKGYEIFALGTFYYPESKVWIGHFFWIVDITDDGVVWTFDPYYGNDMIPLDVHRWYTVKYKAAFAFKFNGEYKKLLDKIK